MTSSALDLAERIAKSRPEAIVSLTIDEKALIVRALQDAAEVERLRADVIQMRAFAKMMDETNWRDMSLRMQRQGVR
jgi:hypothetical protein